MCSLMGAISWVSDLWAKKGLPQCFIPGCQTKAWQPGPIAASLVVWNWQLCDVVRTRLPEALCQCLSWKRTRQFSQQQGCRHHGPRPVGQVLPQNPLLRVAGSSCRHLSQQAKHLMKVAEGSREESSWSIDKKDWHDVKVPAVFTVIPVGKTATWTQGNKIASCEPNSCVSAESCGRKIKWPSEHLT